MIKNIVFDVGRVLVTFNPEEYLKKLGYDERTRQKIEEAMFKNPLWNEQDRGVLSDEELLSKFVANAPEYEEQIKEAFEKIAAIIELLPHTMEWVKGLKAKGYQLYVLSNYGEYTYEQTKHKLEFLSYMDGSIFSFQYKVIKPEREIYELLLNKFELKAEESVFIDDRLENVEAAKALGFSGIQFQSYEQAEKELEKMMHIDKLLEDQRRFFQSGATLSVQFRVEMLKRLRRTVQKYENEIADALKKDLGKSDFEGFMCEVGLVLSEIRYMIRHTRKFAAKHRVRTPLSQFAASSYKKALPYGNTLIMSPWNYPFLLAMDPLADAIAAGNTAIVKPSAYSPATSKVIEKIVTECFPSEYVAVVTGGRKENASLLEKKFDFVFFTGSQNVGKEVLRHTAETLTPAVLELGGKSPSIVDDTAKLKLAAKRIVFGKYLNCGQTCVAPDYILCHRSVKELFVKEVCDQIKKQYGENPLANPDYGKIINEKHFERVCRLIDRDKVVIGGNIDRNSLQIAPTVMDNVTWEDAVMQEEIFGPVMPILTFDEFDEVYELMANKPKPLAFYLFSEDKKRIHELTERCAYGGGCINDTIIHLATSEMGFGGVGESGMGSYHGKEGFDAFSHTKSMVNKKTWMDLPMRYQPYKRGLYGKLLHLFLK